MMNISKTTIETGLWHIERYLMMKHGVDAARRDIDPLKQYVYSGRASTTVIRAILTAKPYMVGRKLHQGGSCEEVVGRVLKYAHTV